MPNLWGLAQLCGLNFLIALSSFLSLHCDNGFGIIHVMSYMRYIWTKLKIYIFERELQKGAIKANLEKKVLKAKKNLKLIN